MIFGCGIDIEELQRFDKHYFQNGKLSDLMYDLFTLREIENFSFFGKKAFLKGFCFKEAFYKALNSENISWFDIEILFNDDDNFTIHNSDFMQNHLNCNQINKVDVNFNQTDIYVTCKVLLIK